MVRAKGWLFQATGWCCNNRFHVFVLMMTLAKDGQILNILSREGKETSRTSGNLPCAPRPAGPSPQRWALLAPRVGAACCHQSVVPFRLPNLHSRSSPRKFLSGKPEKGSEKAKDPTSSQLPALSSIFPLSPQPRILIWVSISSLHRPPNLHFITCLAPAQTGFLELSGTSKETLGFSLFT